jgi:Cu+-exporting ATPase
MNHGADVASAAADILLMRDDLNVIPWLFDLSREAMKRVRQNLGWAFIYNLIGIGLAAAGLLQPVFSAFAMVASSVFVTTNAMKMNKFPLLYREDDEE